METGEGKRSFIASILYQGMTMPSNILGAGNIMMDGTYSIRLSCWKISREGSRRQRLRTVNIRRTPR